MNDKGGRRSEVSDTRAIRTLKARSERLIAVCGKCGRKLGGGFGPDGDQALAKRLRRVMADAKGKRAAILIVETKCMDICPKRAVALVDSAAPGKVTIVPARTSAALVVDSLGGRVNT